MTRAIAEPPMPAEAVSDIDDTHEDAPAGTGPTVRQRAANLLDMAASFDKSQPVEVRLRELESFAVVAASVTTDLLLVVVQQADVLDHALNDVITVVNNTARRVKALEDSKPASRIISPYDL